VNGPKNNPLPAAIAALLRRLIRRARLVIALRGVFALTAVAVIALLLVMAADSVLLVWRPWQRWLLSASFYGPVAAAAWWFLVRPLARSFTAAGVARMVEARHPELQERLSSAIELLTSQDSQELRGSQTLINALTDAATLDAAGLEPRREMSFRAALPWFGVCLLPVTVLVLLTLLWPDRAKCLVSRATAPFLDLGNLPALQLEVTPGDTTVALGSRVEIAAEWTAPNATPAYLLRLDPDGRETREELLRVNTPTAGRQRFLLTYPNVDKQFLYRVMAGRALTRAYRVDVAVPPAIRQVEVRYEYPAYTRFPPRTENNGGAVSALAGSTATLTVHINKAVADARLTIEGAQATVISGTPAESATDTDGARYQFRLPLVAGTAGIYTLRFKDDFKLENPRYERTVQAVADCAPAATLDLGGREIHLTRNDRVTLAVTAADDVGLASVHLLVAADGAALSPQPFQLPPDDDSAPLPKRFSGSTTIELSDPAFDKANRVTVQVKAADNLPATASGPQTGLSDMLTILLDDGAKSFQEQAFENQVKEIRQTLEAVKKDIATAERQMDPIRQRLEKEEPVKENTAKTIDETRARLAEANRILRNLADRSEGGFFAKLPEDLRRFAEDPVNRLLSQLSQIKLADRQTERVKLATDTQASLKTAAETLNMTLADIDRMAREIRTALALSKLADRQTELARERATAQPPTVAGADATTPHPPDDPARRERDEAWAREQNKVAAQLTELTRQDPAALAALADASSRKFADMASQYRDLAETQKQTAGLAPKAAAVAESQREVSALARDQAALATETTRLRTKPEDAATAMNHAVEALRDDQPAQAVPNQKMAAENLRQTKAADEKETQRQNALAKRQDDLARKTEDAASRHAQARQACQDTAREQLARRQQDLTAAAAALQSQTARLPDPAAKLPDGVADSAQRTQQALADPAAFNPQTAAAEAAKTARELRDLERALNRDAAQRLAAHPEASAPSAALADKAGQLAERQEQLQKTLATLAAKTPTAAAVQDQADLTARVADAHRDMADWRNFERHTFGDKQDPGLRQQQDRVTDLLGQAKESAGNAANDLKRLDREAVESRRNPDRQMPRDLADVANRSQDQTADRLADAAANMDALANSWHDRATALRQQAATDATPPAQPNTAPEVTTTTPDPAQARERTAALVAEATQQTRDAARDRTATTAIQAADTLQQAANRAADRIRDFGALTEPSRAAAMMATSTSEGGGTGGPRTAEEALVHQRFGIRMQDWIKLPGNLRDEVLQAAANDGPEEYRPIIRRYFEELSKQRK